MSPLLTPPKFVLQLSARLGIDLSNKFLSNFSTDNEHMVCALSLGNVRKSIILEQILLKHHCYSMIACICRHRQK